MAQLTIQHEDINKMHKVEG